MRVRPILLRGYAAKQRARLVHNEWDQTIDNVAWEPPPELQVRFDSGQAFEANVFALALDTLGSDRCRDLSAVHGRAAAIEATVKAMDDGVEVILGGWLPDDRDGGRAGRPDLLLRYGNTTDGAAYVAGDVKAHKATRTKAKGRLYFSRLSGPGLVLEQPGLTGQTTSRLDDFLQLAHYWRMLEACGRAPMGVDATAFIVGTDDLSDLDALGVVLVWHDLTATHFETYSRSRGKAKRSALERYDHELGFRLDVAKVAASRTGSDHDPQPLVAPIFKDECDSSPWHDYCCSVAGEAVASAHITSGRLSVREWHALSEQGISSVDDLACLDTDSATFQDAYLPEVTHLKDPLDRLRVAIRRAGMIKAGISLERETIGPIAVPRADVEVDFDIEWDVEGRVYLWGALVHRDGVASYQPTVAWEPLDDASELALVDQFADWLRTLVQESEAQGQSFLVYHYSHPEPTYLKRLLGEDHATDLTDHFVDLLTIVREHYFGLAGLGIKKVAPPFGFHWRDEEPGGLQSQLWLLEARDPFDAEAASLARQRILAYNEDDVRATAAIRDGMGAQPGREDPLRRVARDGEDPRR